MPAGFQVWGDNGAFRQVDSNFRALRMSKKGGLDTDSVFYANGGDGGLWFAKSIDVQGQYPIVAFRSSAYCFVYSYYVSEGNWVYTFVTQGRAHVDYWVFNELPPQATNVGIQIYKEDGATLVFDGGDKAAKIADFWTYTGPLLNVNQNVIRNMPSASLAVCHVQLSCTTQKSPTTQITVCYTTSMIGSQFTLMSLRPIVGPNTSMPAQTSAMTNPSFLYLEVGGY